MCCLAAMHYSPCYIISCGGEGKNSLSECVNSAFSKSTSEVYLPGCSADYSLCLHLAMVHAVKKLMFYQRTTPTATGVLCPRIWAYYKCGYGCTTTAAMGIHAGVLR